MTMKGRFMNCIPSHESVSEMCADRLEAGQTQAVGTTYMQMWNARTRFWSERLACNGDTKHVDH